MNSAVAHHINDTDVRFFKIDIVSAYISAFMKRDVYVFPPPEFRSDKTKYLVHKVVRALYGGIDSGRCYYDHWSEFHLKLGFQPIHHDKCYYHFKRGNEFIKFCFHVDDSAFAVKGDSLWK